MNVRNIFVYCIHLEWPKENCLRFRNKSSLIRSIFQVLSFGRPSSYLDWFFISSRLTESPRWFWWQFCSFREWHNQILQCSCQPYGKLEYAKYYWLFRWKNTSKLGLHRRCIRGWKASDWFHFGHIRCFCFLTCKLPHDVQKFFSTATYKESCDAVQHLIEWSKPKAPMSIF